MATGRIGTTPVLTTRWSKAPSAGTTSLSGLDDNSVSLVYSVGYEAVYQNGVLLSRGNDYTATNGTTITLTTATVAGDIIEVFANQTIPLTDTYSQTVSDGRFIKNTLTTTTGDIIYASAANTPARLGIGSTNQVLTVSGGVPSWATPSSGSWTLLYTVNLSGATVVTQNVDFTGYQQAIVVVDNTKDAVNTYNLTTAFNGANTGVYGVVTSFDSASVVTRSNGRFSQEGSGGAQKSNTIVEYFLTINNPASTSKFKQVEYVVTYTRNAAGDPIWAQEIVGFYRSTSAITSITWDSNAGNMASGSQALIYGVK